MDSKLQVLHGSGKVKRRKDKEVTRSHTQFGMHRANRHEVPRCRNSVRANCDTLEMIWSIPREREDFRFFWNNGDDPSRTNFLFDGLHQANKLRPAQGYCGWEADILGTTASLGLDGVSRLDHLHGARRP
jgi:hypothetical protein